MGTVIKFPDEGRTARFGRVDGQDDSATVIILPVIRIERYVDATSESIEPRTEPPAGGRRRRAKRP
jgi:hypothetical protein